MTKQIENKQSSFLTMMMQFAINPYKQLSFQTEADNQ